MKLRSKLSLAFALIVLLTVALISLLSNIFINHEFKKYVSKQQEQKTEEIISRISEQYNNRVAGWDLDFVHTIGMYALHDGYIVKVTDIEGNVLWNAEECDMTACRRIMDNISSQMRTKCPNMNGKFTIRDFDISQNGTKIGTATISYFGPYFLSDNDFRFLDALNAVLISIGISCLLLSALVGLFMAKRISEPVSKAAQTARKMAGGDYTAFIDSKNDTAELRELVDSINLLAESLSGQEALRKQLTADVAHELRTPVTSVQTHLEAMMEGLWEPTPERLGSCYEEAIRIGTLIKDLENLARADNGSLKLDKKMISLSQVWKKVIGGFEREIETKSLSVAIDGFAPDIMADEDRISQVAANLLSNAVKYTPQNGNICVTISQTETDAVFIVTDDGAGIPDDELPFIFERLYRADKSRNRKTGGVGIGLAIVKSIVKAHGGKVEAESKIGHGSRFTVILPLS